MIYLYIIVFKEQPVGLIYSIFFLFSNINFHFYFISLLLSCLLYYSAPPLVSLLASVLSEFMTLHCVLET